MKEAYVFDPEEFGYEPLENFPELKNSFGPTTLIKVTAIGNKESMGRAVYWYSACHPMTDDRWQFYSKSYDADDPEKKNARTNETYCGLISSHEFAVMLLKHIFGTSKQSSVEVEGAERLEQNINQERFS